MACVLEPTAECTDPERPPLQPDAGAFPQRSEGAFDLSPTSALDAGLLTTPESTSPFNIGCAIKKSAAYYLVLELITHDPTSDGFEEGNVSDNTQLEKNRHLMRTHAQSEYLDTVVLCPTDILQSAWKVRYVGNASCRLIVNHTFTMHVHHIPSAVVRDMKTIHAIADPHLRVELSANGQYCGPTNPGTKLGTKKGARTKKP